MRRIFSKLLYEMEEEHNVMLVTVVADKGSAPRGAGAEMLGGANGRIFGSITVEVQEQGCKPITIGKLYGGGYLADYSIYGYDKKKGTLRTKKEFEDSLAIFNANMEFSFGTKEKSHNGFILFSPSYGTLGASTFIPYSRNNSVSLGRSSLLVYKESSTTSPYMWSSRSQPQIAVPPSGSAPCFSNSSTRL